MIRKHIRDAAGVTPGSVVSVNLDGGKNVIAAVSSAVTSDRRSQLLAAAAKVRSSMSPDFKQLGTQEIMDFLRGTDAVAPPTPAPTPLSAHAVPAVRAATGKKRAHG